MGPSCVPARLGVGGEAFAPGGMLVLPFTTRVPATGIIAALQSAQAFAAALATHGRGRGQGITSAASCLINVRYSGAV